MWGPLPLSRSAREALIHALGKLPASATRRPKSSWAGVIALGVVFVAFELDRLWLHAGVLMFIALALVLGERLLPVAYCGAAESIIRLSMRRGSYERAIGVAQGWTRRWYPARRARLSAQALLAAGRAEESEAEARTGIEAAQTDGMVHSLLITLGDALRTQGRGEDAARCYEGAAMLDKPAVKARGGASCL